MGKSGTDLAQQASSIVLMDDNVSTLVSAIEEVKNFPAKNNSQIFLISSKFTFE